MSSAKRKFDEVTGEFWSLDGVDEDEKDPSSDLILVVKPISSTSSSTTIEENASPVSYRVHRVKLGQNSEFLDGLFRRNSRENNTTNRVEIELDPSVAQHFDTMLEFLYNKDKIQFKLLDFNVRYYDDVEQVEFAGNTEPEDFRFHDFTAKEEADPAIITISKLIPLARGAKILQIPGLHDLILDFFKTGNDAEAFKDVISSNLRDFYCWSQARKFGMKEIETQILSNLVNFPCYRGYVGMFDLLSGSDLPDKYRLPKSEKVAVLEAALEHMEKMQRNKQLDPDRRELFSLAALQASFYLTTRRPSEFDRSLKSIFDRIVVSQEDFFDHFPKRRVSAKQILVQYARFYPSKSTPGNIKLTRTEANLTKALLDDTKVSPRGLPGNLQIMKLCTDDMSELPYHILSVIAASHMCENGENLIDQLVVEEENE